MLNNHNKKVSFFVVLDKTDESHFLSVTCNKKDAYEFAYKFLRIQNFDHFQMWCDLRNYKVDSLEAWDKYFAQVVSIEEKQKYIIRKITYKLNDLAAVLRMFGGCLPIGCDFDTETEYGYLRYKLETQKAAKSFTNTLNDILEKAKKEGDKENVQ